VLEEIIDNIVLLLFIAFIFYIFRGYHLNRLEQMESDLKNDNPEKPETEKLSEN